LITAHVVAHTHWDREWYQPFVRFRQRLVALVDELLDHPPPKGESFLLDGQAIILEDYLDVRPERAADLSSLLRDGRLEAGPWYVLADELIPSGEALVRNLLLGRRVLQQMGASPPAVLYCPDSFGHPAALPSIAAGFGLPLAIVWRGFGGRRWPDTDTLRWRASNGDGVVMYHLARSGYEYGSALPTAPRLAEERWNRIRDELAPRSATSVVLLPNGADHHRRQEQQHQAVRALKAAAKHSGDIVRPSSLSGFAKHVLDAAAAWSLPEIAGELRDSYGYTWTLQGTFGSRAAQKRANARAERALLRDAEPWAALAHRRGAVSRLPHLVAAWRTLLQAHPHDTLCGCSIDPVAEAMDLRLEDAMVQATGIRDDALADLIAYDASTIRATAAPWTPFLLVRNRAARQRGGVAVVEIKEFLADVPVGPGSASAPMRGASRSRQVTLAGIPALQILSRRISYDRLESPRQYPDNDLVSATRAAIWMEPVPGYGGATVAVGTSTAPLADVPRPVRASGTVLNNDLVSVAVSNDGKVALSNLTNGRQMDDLFRIEDCVDKGDLYTPSIRETPADAEFAGVTITRAGPLLGELKVSWKLHRLTSEAKAMRRSRLDVRIGLQAESALVRLSIQGVNAAQDHRLRLGVRSDVVDPQVWADAAFGSVHRTPIAIPNDEARDETPPPTAPLHRYVSLFGADKGLTVFSDGLAEYEVKNSGEILLTLLRAVGVLSRRDLPERPGHAGWPAPTPKAQSLGPFSARFALLFHGPRNPDTIDEIERVADDVLLPLEGRTYRSLGTMPPGFDGIELQGCGLALSTIKQSENGEWLVLRCVNLLETPVDGAWRVGIPLREARRARLDETPTEAVTVREGLIAFEAPPRAIVTFLIR
jgi:alpha-mannosidase